MPASPEQITEIILRHTKLRDADKPQVHADEDGEEIDYPPLKNFPYQAIINDKPYLLENDDVVRELLENNTQLTLDLLTLIEKNNLERILTNLNSGEKIADKIKEALNAELEPCGIAIDQLWKLLIDGRNMNGGRKYYDWLGERAEPGYISKMEEAFFLMLREINSPLSVELITELHNMACANVLLISPEAPVSFGKMPANAARGLSFEPDDLKELLTFEFFDIELRLSQEESPIFLSGCSLGTKKTLDDFAKILNEAPNAVGSKRKSETRSADEVLKGIIAQFEVNIKSAITEDEKLMAIAKFAKQVDALHPFTDGNMRTIVLLIYDLLIKNGLSLTIMANPNDLDIKSSRWFIDHQLKPGRETLMQHELPIYKNLIDLIEELPEDQFSSLNSKPEQQREIILKIEFFLKNNLSPEKSKSTFLGNPAYLGGEIKAKLRDDVEKLLKELYEFKDIDDVHKKLQEQLIQWSAVTNAHSENNFWQVYRPFSMLITECIGIAESAKMSMPGLDTPSSK